MICRGHLGEAIEAGLGDGGRFGLSIAYSDEGADADRHRGRPAARAARCSASASWSCTATPTCASTTRPSPPRHERSGSPALMTVLRNRGRWGPSNVVYARGRVLRLRQAHAAAGRRVDRLRAPGADARGPGGRRARPRRRPAAASPREGELAGHAGARALLRDRHARGARRDRPLPQPRGVADPHGPPHPHAPAGRPSPGRGPCAAAGGRRASPASWSRGGTVEVDRPPASRASAGRRPRGVRRRRRQASAIRGPRVAGDLHAQPRAPRGSPSAVARRRAPPAPRSRRRRRVAVALGRVPARARRSSRRATGAGEQRVGAVRPERARGRSRPARRAS